MPPDPIVEEVRAIRDEIAKENGYDVTRILESLQKLQLPSGVRVVSLPPKRIARTASTRETA